MVVGQREEKDISKIFSVFRAQLQAKEKQLLELQRSDPSLLAPDANQIDALLEAIAALQLSTQDGLFLFASTSVNGDDIDDVDDDDDDDDNSSYTSGCSTDFNSIKTLPSNIWLAESNYIKQQKPKASCIFNHLLSLPLHAFLASSTSLVDTSIKSQNQSVENIPIINRWPFMPIDAFKSLTTAPTTFTENTNYQYEQNNCLGTKSVFDNNPAYTKQYWLQSKPTRRTSMIDTEATFSKQYWIQNNQQSIPISQSPTKSLVNNENMFSKQYWLQNSPPKSPTSTKSLVNAGGTFSKEFWLNNN